MAQSFEELPKNVIRKELPAKDALPRHTESVESVFGRRDREDWQEKTGDTMSPKDFNVWVVRTELSRNRPMTVPNAMEVQNSMNVERSDDSNQRFVQVSDIPQRELRHELPHTYRGKGEVRANHLPDLVVAYGGEGYVDGEPESSLSLSMKQFETQAIRDIRAAADSTLYDEFSHPDPIEDGRAYQTLAADILGETYFRTATEAGTITRERALEYMVAHLFQDDTDDEEEVIRAFEEKAARAFDQYAQTGNEEFLRALITPERIKKAMNEASSFSTASVREQFHDRLQVKKQSGFSNEKEFVVYRRKLTKAVTAVLREPSEETNETFFQTFKRLVDSKVEEYRRFEDWEKAERKLLQPVIVSVGKSLGYREASLAAGADAIVPNLTSEEMRLLVAFANRMRTSPASLIPDRVRRSKNVFYETHVADIEARSEQTADTEKELQILDSLFQKVGAKKVLDVGAGYGRLALPLAERGYEVTGLEGNRSLLEQARRADTKQQVHFMSGDVIDYRESVKHGEHDAVMYGWHTFLEAYGLGNALTSLSSARLTLKPGGIVVFDQPTRENKGMTDGWYGDEKSGQLAYLMEDDELKFLLKLSGFEDVHIMRWTSKPSDLYPNGMRKMTVVAKKPQMPEIADKWWEKSNQEEQ